MNRAIIAVLVKTFLFALVGARSKEKRGIASNKYHVNAENKKQDNPSMAIDIVESNFKLMLNHVKANIEYRGENMRLSMLKSIPIICLPDAT